MGMVAPWQRIASAYVVFCGRYGEVRRYAQQRGTSRQWIHREAVGVVRRLEQGENYAQALERQVRELQEQKAALEERLRLAVVIDEDKQVEFSCVGQARGVSLLDCWELLQVLVRAGTLSRPTLGRRTQALGKKAGALLAVLDEFTRPKVQDALADEIHVKAPVLMMVEPESLCWLAARRTAAVSGEAWAEEMGRLPNLKQVTRDGGKALAQGVALLSAQRQAQDQATLFDQGDHFHALRGRGRNLYWYQVRARQALAKAEASQKSLEECTRQGQARGPAATRARLAWKRAERAMDHWCEVERCWQKTKQALTLFTPQGEWNTRPQATAVLTATLPQLPEEGFAKSKRALQKPEMLSYLDRAQEKIRALPFPQEVTAAAVRQEGLRRRPELLREENTQTAALHGVLMMCALVLSKAGRVGEEAVAAVRDICRRAYRASSLVECVNSVLRMQQARHRRLSQELLDLKRLYWNCHTFHTGRRRATTPYQRLGVPWPKDLSWLDVFKLTPEQLREKLSTSKMPD
jgi:hypothetical protein